MKLTFWMSDEFVCLVLLSLVKLHVEFVYHVTSTVCCSATQQLLFMADNNGCERGQGGVSVRVMCVCVVVFWQLENKS